MLELLTGEPVFWAKTILDFIRKIIDFTGIPDENLLRLMGISEKYFVYFENMHLYKKVDFLHPKNLLLEKVENLKAREII